LDTDQASKHWKHPAMDGIEMPPHGRGGIFDVARQDRRDDRDALREAPVALGRLSRAAPLTPKPSIGARL